MRTVRRLFVLRHAKSSWDDPTLGDHDRPLAARGREAVKLLREHVRRERVTPELVLCSSARRTVETLEGVSPPGAVSIERELYEASCSHQIERLRRVPAENESVMVIGHNPALQMLVLTLAGEGEIGEVRRKFPTGALATLEFDRDWSELAPGCAVLVAYVRPKQLH